MKHDFVRFIITSLYMTLTLIAAKFPEKFCRLAAHTEAAPPLRLRPTKEQKDDFTGTQPVAA
jgi:hypothetical protein